MIIKDLVESVDINRSLDRPDKWKLWTLELLDRV